MFGLQPGLLPQLAPGSFQRLFALRTATLRNLPGVQVQRVPVLSDEVDVIIFDRQDADGDFLVVYDSVDARLPIRTGDSVLAHGDPGVVVDLPRRDGPPGASRLLRIHTIPRLQTPPPVRNVDTRSAKLDRANRIVPERTHRAPGGTVIFKAPRSESDSADVVMSDHRPNLAAILASWR